jgi:hypothetical protein
VFQSFVFALLAVYPLIAVPFSIPPGKSNGAIELSLLSQVAVLGFLEFAQSLGEINGGQM